MARAVGTWGEAHGLAIAHRIQVFVSAVLRSRPAPVTYVDPLDIATRKSLTLDEIDLLALLTCMRPDRTASAREIIPRITGGRIDVAIVRSGLELAGMLDPSGKQPPRGGRPKLCSVN